MRIQKLRDTVITAIKTHPILTGFILFKLIFSLLPLEYGIFRNELYCLAMSKQPAFDYLDVPPLAPFLQFLTRNIIGTFFVGL